MDIGAGAGRFSVTTAKKGADVIALDIYPRTIRVMKEIIDKQNVREKISFLIADAEKLPLKSEAFDIVLCIETLMHLPNPQVASLEICRILKKGRFAILQTNNKFSLKSFKRFLRQKVIRKVYHFLKRKALSKQTPHYWTCSILTFRNYLSRSGFKIIRFRSNNPFTLKMMAVVQK